MSNYSLQREVRTPHSESFFVVDSEDRDAGRLDVHYPPGMVHATLVIRENVTEEDLREIVNRFFQEMNQLVGWTVSRSPSTRIKVKNEAFFTTTISTNAVTGTVTRTIELSREPCAGMPWFTGCITPLDYGFRRNDVRVPVQPTTMLKSRPGM